MSRNRFKKFRRVTNLEFTSEFQKLFNKAKIELKSLQSLAQEKVVQANLKGDYDYETMDKMTKTAWEQQDALYDLIKKRLVKVEDMNGEINEVLDEILDGVIKSTGNNEYKYTTKVKTKNVYSDTTEKNKVHTRSTSARMDCRCFSSPSKLSQKRKIQRRQKRKSKDSSLFWTITVMLLKRRRRRRRMRKQKKVEVQLRKKVVMRRKKK